MASAIKAKYEEQFNFLTNVLEELYALIENTKNGVKDYYELNQPFYAILLSFLGIQFVDIK